MPRIERNVIQDDHPITTRIRLMEGETELSHVSVLHLSMRVGGAVVTCGGIGGVGTDREHRNRGHARTVLTNALEYMADQGMHLSALFGIPDFYHRFGYAAGLVDCHVQLATRYAERAESRYDVRPFRPEDAPAVLAMYEATHHTRTGSIVREASTWRGFRRGTRWSDRVDAYVVVENERPIGYACHDLHPWRCTLAEVGYATPAAFSTILAHAARIAWDRRAEHITVHATPDDPFVRYCRRYGCEITLTYPCCSSGMVRVVNQSGLLDALRPVFARRLRDTLPGWDGTLVIHTELGEDRLKFGPARHEIVVHMPQWMLAQLVLGYRSADDAAFESEAQIGEEALPVLRALFPEGYPYVNWPDRF